MSRVETTAAVTSTGSLFAAGRRLCDRADTLLALPRRLHTRWTEPSRQIVWGAADDAVSASRLTRFRRQVVPWLDRTRTLEDARILEVGSGAGASTVALAEQGARVVGLDISAEALEVADSRCRAHGVSAAFEVGNALDLATLAPAGTDWIVFWAVLEHMTIAERIGALRAAWSVLPPGGLLTVVETPNRLWWHDSHTSKLPFFHWLPDALAYRYAQFSPRAGFADVYPEEEPGPERMMHFLRRGRGMSFHEFEVAIGPVRSLWVASCLQIARRRRNPARGVGWALSRAGRYERMLRATAPSVPRAWLQPFLYLTLRRSADPG